MKHKIIFILIFIWALLIPAQAQTIRRIEKLRPLYLDTVLVSGGKAAAIIAAPKSDAKLANKIIARVKSLTGVALTLMDDKEVSENEFRSTNIIVIGNFMTNKVAELLYLRQFTFEDHIYPGIAGKAEDGDGPPQTGYVIRTVHDPFAFGHNFIVLAGSEPAGTADAVQEFIDSLKGGQPLVVPHTVKVRFGNMQLMKPSYTKNDLPQEHVDKLLGQIQRTVSNMKCLHNNVWMQADSYALGYLLTGNACWGKVFKGFMQILSDNLDRFNSMPNNYIEDMFSIVPAWDWMEETPFFTDQERLKFTNAVLEVACRNEAAWQHYLKNPRAEALSSHGGDRVQSWRYAGYYFSKHYGINKHWLTLTDKAIKWMNDTPRSCDGYHLGCGHATRLSEYARWTGDTGYIDSGACRWQANLVMMCTDNQGYIVTVGDHDRWQSKISREWNLARYMSEVAWYYKDTSYLWFAQHLAYHEWPFHAFTTGQPPKKPEHLVGLNVLPLHKNIYENIAQDEKNTVRTFEKAPPLTVQCEEGFDKLTFREALDPQKQYLLLDGIGGMDHGHIDVNSIIRYSDLERMWLVDVGWTRCYPRDHNMVLVVKDGECKGPEKIARLDTACDLPTIAFTKTTVPEYNGMTWSRHLIWLKGEGVLALDRLVAKEAGDYSLRCRWRSAGEANLTPGGLTVTQAGARFRILTSDGSQPRLRPLFLDDTNNSMLTYPYMNPRGETIVYDNVVERHFSRGDSYTFQNFFYASSDRVRREYGLERVDDSTVRITSTRGPIIAGLLKGDGLFLIAGARLCAAQAMRIGNPPLLIADKPVDIEYDLATGQGIVVAKSPMRLSLLAPSAEGKIDGAQVKGEYKDGLISLQVPAGKHTLELGLSFDGAARIGAFVASFLPHPIKPAPQPKVAPLRGLTTVWEASVSTTKDSDTTAEILDLLIADLDAKPHIIAATKNGTVTVFTLDGKPRWRQAGLVRADSVAIAKLGNKPHVIVGCHKPPYLFVFTATGARLEGAWEHVSATDPYKGLAAPLHFVAAADMDGDGSDEILATNWCQGEKQIFGYCYCFDKTGRMRWWRSAVNHEVAAWTVSPLKSGGPMVLLCGGTFNSCAGLNASGAECFNALASHRITVISAADVDEDKTNEVLIGGQDNYVHLHEADGQRRWMHNVGGQVSGIAVADINGDKKPDIIATTAELNQNVFALNAAGERLWSFKTGEEVNALAVGNVFAQASPEIVVGTDAGDILILDGKGKRVAGVSLSASVAKLALCALGKSGPSDIVAGLKNGRIVRLHAASK